MMSECFYLDENTCNIFSKKNLSNFGQLPIIAKIIASDEFGGGRQLLSSFIFLVLTFWCFLFLLQA